MWINHQSFFLAYEERFGALAAPKRSGLDALLGYLQLDPSIDDIRCAAYMLATVRHECADLWVPVAEWGNDAYFYKYEPNTPLGTRLGNVVAGDGKRYKGRGYVQITGRANYGKLGRRLGVGDGLEQEPDRALDPLTAYRIMSVGMTEGLFTGRTLASYINGDDTDYLEARRIINGTDQAATIAAYALGLEQALFIALDDKPG